MVLPQTETIPISTMQSLKSYMFIKSTHTKDQTIFPYRLSSTAQNCILKFVCTILSMDECGVLSRLVHWICVLMAESSECGFEPRPRQWCLCPWARHFTIIASLHPGVNGYLWGQSWLLCLISPMRRNGSNWAACTPQGAEMVSAMIYVPDEQG